MRYSIPLLTLLLPATTLAFPLLPPLRPRASYSVVAVDGGSTASTTPLPAATVTDLKTQTQTILQTQLSTVVVTQNATPTTLVVTVTSAATTVVVQTPAPIPASTMMVTVTDSAAADVVTKPYDNGQWHSTYYFTTEIVTPTASTSVGVEMSAVPAATSAAAPWAAAPAAPAADDGFDDGSWAKWAGDGNGGHWSPPTA